MKRQLVGLIVLLTFFAGLITIICVNSKYIFRTEPYYSETEVEQMCKDAYQQSIKDNSDTALYDKMSELTLKNLELINKNEILSTENESLRSDNLLKEKNISDNETVIEKLNSQILKFEENKSANETLIAELREQVNDLDKQNKLLAYEISENEKLIAENNKTIMQLQNSIAYYEDFINGLENDSEVFAIFVIENEIFNIQKLNKNGLAYLEEQPVFEEDATFNGWKVNGEIVDLSSYTLSCNTTFVADISYIYKVNFIVDDVVYNSQNVQRNDCAVLPETPIKEGYSFLGWSLNKVDIVENINSQSVVKNLTYYAIFEKSFNVNFMIGEEIYDSQLISENGSANVPEVPVKDGYAFIGWTSSNSNDLNDVVLNISDLVVTSDINYYAYFVEDYEGRVYEHYISGTHYATFEAIDKTILITCEENFYLDSGTLVFNTIDSEGYSSQSTIAFSSGSQNAVSFDKSRYYDFKFYYNSNNQLVISLTTKNTSIVRFEIKQSGQYFEFGEIYTIKYYILSEGSEISNSISSMTNCYKVQRIIEKTTDFTNVVLPYINDNILGWTVCFEDPNFDSTNMDGLLSTDLAYIGDVNSSFDFYDFIEYHNIKFFAVYKLS